MSHRTFTPPSPQVRVALVSELSQVSQDPALARLLRREPTDLPVRFARYHEYLTHLPRRMRRSLQRQWKRSLPALALLLALGQAPALAATINVDGTTCTLVDAITAANIDRATGGCTRGRRGDTLKLMAGSTHTLTAINNSTYGDTGLPVVSSVITIEGNSSTIARDPGAPAFRIFAVNSTGNLTLNETTVSGGAVTGGGFVFGTGGGIANNGGTVTLARSTVSGNSSEYLCGGVCNRYGTLTLTNSTVSGNSAAGLWGGGVFNDHGTLTLTNSLVSGNTGYHGGGVYNWYGTATITNSTISGNSAGIGGGIGNRSSTMTLTNSTVTGNSAGAWGGGMYTAGNTVTIARSLISGNTVLSPYSRGAELYTFFGTVVTANNNLFGHSGLSSGLAFFGFTPSGSDIVATYDGTTPTALADILNTTLASNGGPTQTHALVADSPAIDASPNDADCQPTDQRGIVRPQGAACDIGAFESEAAASPPSCATATPTSGCTVNGVPNQLCIGSGNDIILGTPGDDVILGLGGNDVLKGGSGADVLCGGDGNDVIEGGPGGDFIDGGAGNDSLKGDGGPDRLLGGSGNDAIQGGSEDDYLDGGAGSDSCNGGSGTDTGTNCEAQTQIP